MQSRSHKHSSVEIVVHTYAATWRVHMQLHPVQICDEDEVFDRRESSPCMCAFQYIVWSSQVCVLLLWGFLVETR